MPRVNIEAREPPELAAPMSRPRSLYHGRFPSPQSVPLTPAVEPEQQQPRKPLVSHQTRTVATPSLGERFGAHTGEAFYNTIAGQAVAGYRGGERFGRQAEQLDKIIQFAESQGARRHCHCLRN